MKILPKCYGDLWEKTINKLEIKLSFKNKVNHPKWEGVDLRDTLEILDPITTHHRTLQR